MPLPPYIKEERRGRGPAPMARPGGVLLPAGVGFLPFQVVGVGDKEGEEKRRKEGAQPLPLVQFRLGLGGAPSLSSLFPLKLNMAHILPGEFP